MKVIQKPLTKSISTPNITTSANKLVGWENGFYSNRDSINLNNKMNNNQINYKIDQFTANIFPELGASPSLAIAAANYLHLEFNHQAHEKKNLWEPSKKPLSTSQTISNRTNKPYLRSNYKIETKIEKILIEKNDSVPNITILDLVGSHINSNINKNSNNSNSQNPLNISNSQILNNIKLSSDDLRSSTSGGGSEKNRSLSNLAKAKNITNNISFGLVLFDYEADCDSDLELTKGQVVIVYKKGDDGWWEGFHYKPVRSDKSGMFPNNYVQILSNNDPLIKSPSVQLPSSLAKQLQQHQEQSQSQSQFQPPPQSPRLPPAKLNQSSSSIQSSLSSSTYNNNKFKSISSISTTSLSSLSHSLSISLPNQQVKLTPIIQKIDLSVQHLKVFIPPFMEFIMVPYTPKDTLRDVLQKIVRNNHFLKDSLCQFKYPLIKSTSNRLSNPQQPQYLTLSQNCESLKDPDTIGVKLLISGMDYIERINNSLSSVKLLNQFYLNYNPQDCYWLQYDQTSIQIKKNPDGPPIRVIGLNYMDIELITCERHYSFSISTLFKEDFVFSSDMVSTVKLWVDTLQQNCQFITYKYGPFYNNSNNSNQNPSTPTSDHSHSISSSSSSSSTFLLSFSEFDQIRRQKCNNKCADCSSVQPEWASLQFGIFLCDTCSDIHQEHLKNPDSLGVISALLDEPTIWSDYIQLFKKLGNINSNNYYEANLPVHIKKPQPSSTILEKIQYFKLKYIDKSFIPR